MVLSLEEWGGEAGFRIVSLSIYTVFLLRGAKKKKKKAKRNYKRSLAKQNFSKIYIYGKDREWTYQVS